MDEAEFFKGRSEAQAIFRAVKATVDEVGESEVRVSKSQIGFRRAHPFAAVWKPDQYLAGQRPPLVLSIYLRHRDPSDRWKEVVQPRPGRFTHHLELRAADEVDDQVRVWLSQAWSDAG